MSSRHVPTRRLQSGVLFSAPDETQRFPPDETRQLPKKWNNILTRTPNVRGVEPVDDICSVSSAIPDCKWSFSMFATYRDHSDYGSLPKPSPEVDFVPSKEKKATLCLPVLKVSSTTMIEGTLAHTTLIQSFRNPSQMTIKEARHTFPLYDGAVVTNFECTIGDERRLRGVVKSKEQARKEYKKAVQEQAKAAALLEEQTPDIFETSLGNIPPMTTVEIKMIYIQELKVVMMEGEATEGVAFIVPTSIAPRYGKSQSASEITHDGLDIKIRVLNDGKVNADGCQEESGHKVYYDGPRAMESPQGFDGNREQPLREYYCWDHHRGQAAMTKDFVFVIQMKKGHEMQSQALLSPPDDAGLAAMMVSIRPSELFRNAIVPQSFSGEILFLLDQSSSMGDRVGDYGRPPDGSPFFFQDARCPRKIDILREAMLLVISGLPKTCSFNIISWGSETWAMWEQSRKHSPDNIKEAREYIFQIEANLRGTDLLRALKSTIQRRRGDSNSTQVVVLTDGELNPNEPMNFVWKTRQALQDKVRFFALGIGSNVPHSLIESIAELGGGFGDIIDTTQNPRWHSRLNRLFKSSLEPDSWTCDIDIGHEFEQHSLVDFRLNDYASDTQRVPYFKAPHAITNLQPFKFTTIFFLINVKDHGVLPTEVTITTTTNGAKKKTYRLPVLQTTGRDGTMHRLASKAILVDLENLIKEEPSSSPLAEENAQAIGTRYSITSKWTSFVAVPQDEQSAATEDNMMEHYKAMYDDVGFDKLVTMANFDSDDDTEDVRTSDADYAYIPKPKAAKHARQTSSFHHRTRRSSTINEKSSADRFHMIPQLQYSLAKPSRGGSRVSSSEFETESETERAVSPDTDVQINRQAPDLKVIALARRPVSTVPSVPDDVMKKARALYFARLRKAERREEMPRYDAASSSASAALPLRFGEPVTAPVCPVPPPAAKEAPCRPPSPSEPAMSPAYRIPPSVATELAYCCRRKSVAYEANGPACDERSDSASGTPSPAMDRRLPIRRPPTQACFGNYIDNEVLQKRESLSGHASSPSPKTIDPLNWEVAVKYQNGQGLFELPGSSKGSLYLHFCPDALLAAVEKLDLLLSSQARYQGTSDAVVVDTIMTVLCYKTHLALEEDLWDLMMERARDAVTEAIGQDTLEIMEEYLNASMMHEHYIAVEGVDRYGDRESIHGTRCPVCRIRWQSSGTFSCNFEHGPLKPHVFLDWEAFWKHQKENGHVICPRE